MATLGLLQPVTLLALLVALSWLTSGIKLAARNVYPQYFLNGIPNICYWFLTYFETIGAAAPLLLLLMRIMQGAAIGGEMPGAWVFIAEHTPKQRYGLGVGTLTSGITGGILLGSIVAIIIERSYTTTEIHDFAWRIPFILGGVFGFISVYLRRFYKKPRYLKNWQPKRPCHKNYPSKPSLSLINKLV